jgi:hypothetical protein
MERILVALPRTMKALLFALLCACATEATTETVSLQDSDLAPTGHHGINNHAGGGGRGGFGISYHGGPVIEGTVNVYYIWYGDWSNNTAVNILTDLANNIGGTPYYNINKGYYDLVNGGKRNVTGLVHYAGSTTDAYSQGTSLDDNGVFAVVNHAVSTAALPEDTNAVYFVLTSADVNETTGFCTQYCGWHWFGTDSAGHDLRYAFVGNPDRCPSACEAQTTSPNGNAGADGMASIITHELEEANTDPEGNAWYDRQGNEDADKCAWNFGTEQTAANGSKYNVVWGGKQYLVQQEWKVTGGCALQ